MSIQKSVVKNRFGEFFKVQLPRENNAQLTLKPESFWNEESTRQFINNLTVPNGYWREIINECNALPCPSSLTTNEIEKKVSALMIQGQLKLYPVEIPDIVEHPPEKLVIKSSDNILYRFAHVSTLLLNNNSETKTFKNKDDAKKFLTEISSDNKQLTTIANELYIKLPVTAVVNHNETAEEVSQALASGDIVVIVDKTSTVPSTPKEVLNKSDIGNKKADLGPHETEEPPQHWFAIQLVNEADEPYKNETFTIKLSNNYEEKINGGSANYRKEQLLSGKCKVTFTNFYITIEQWLEERSQ